MLSRRPFQRLGYQLKAISLALSSPSSSLSPYSTSSPPSTLSPTTTSKPTAQAPNHPTTWSTNQRQRPVIGQGPRFEQTAMEFQPNPLSAVDLISHEPVHIVHGRKAVCDGGGGPLGHPKIYINLDQPGAHSCGYCGLRFEQGLHH